MYLYHYQKDTFFEIKEIWFPYNDREYHNARGIYEGAVVYINDKNSEGVTLTSEAQIEKETKSFTTTFDYHQCKCVCGKQVDKKPKQKTKKKSLHL